MKRSDRYLDSMPESLSYAARRLSLNSRTYSYLTAAGARNIGPTFLVFQMLESNRPRLAISVAGEPPHLAYGQHSCADRGNPCPQEPRRAFHRNHHVAAGNIRGGRRTSEVVRDAGP